MKPEDYITREERHGAHNYHPLPVKFLRRGEGVFVWDGRKCFISCSAILPLSQGHVIQDREGPDGKAEKLTLASRAFMRIYWVSNTEFTCKVFGYDKLADEYGGRGG